MGSVFYSAIPPKSTLYKRLQQEKALNALMVDLFSYGCDIYRFFETAPDDVEEILASVINWSLD